MKKDIITFELSKGSLIAIGTATLAMGAVSVALKFLTGGDLSSSEMQDIFAMIPLVNIGVLSIFYLVAGCLSLQYMRLLMLFGATRTTAFVRYVIRVAVTMNISLIGLLAVYFISGMISGFQLLSVSTYILSFALSAFLGFSAGCLFSSITTLFKPFISFLVIAAICITSLPGSEVLEVIDEVEAFSLVHSVIIIAVSLILLALASAIHHLRMSDMKTTSIS